MADGAGSAPRHLLAVATGRATRRLLRLVRPGGGTALPGLVAARVSPGLLQHVLRQPRLGTVVVSGSSGKSTTAALIRAVLEAHGLSVLANRRTANIPHGIVAELLPQLDLRARTAADVAVIEADEGFAGAVAAAASARVVVLLNVMVDQLHRWEEPELVAAYLARAAAAAKEVLVVNADDPHVAAIGQARERAGAAVRRFGLSSAARAALPHATGSAPAFGPGVSGEGARDVVVESVAGDRAVLRTAAGPAVLRLPGRGAHIAADAAAAIEGAAAVLGDRYDAPLAHAAIARAGVFGRGETVSVHGAEVELILTKSPATMQANLDLLERDGTSTMVAIGRDIFDASQLWLADWRRLERVRVVTGWQAWEAALRLAYDEVEVDAVEEDLGRAVLRHVTEALPAGVRRRVVMTPESMRAIRRRLRLDRAEP